MKKKNRETTEQISRGAKCRQNNIPYLNNNKFQTISTSHSQFIILVSGRSLCMISGNADLASPIVTGPELAVKAPSSEEIMVGAQDPILSTLYNIESVMFCLSSLPSRQKKSKNGMSPFSVRLQQLSAASSQGEKYSPIYHNSIILMRFLRRLSRYL